MTTYNYELKFTKDDLTFFKVTDNAGNSIGENTDANFLKRLVNGDQPSITSVVTAMTDTTGNAPKINTLKGGKKKQTKKSKQRNNKTKRQRKRSFSISKSI
jgi:hypothetical protein